MTAAAIEARSRAIPSTTAPWRLAHNKNKNGKYPYRRRTTSDVINGTRNRAKSCGRRDHAMADGITAIETSTRRRVGYPSVRHHTIHQVADTSSAAAAVKSGKPPARYSPKNRT